jgi:dTMP kinase
MLHAYLAAKEIPVFITAQPTETMRKSEVFREFIDNPAPQKYDYRSLTLFTAGDRLQHSNKVIEPILKRGVTVLSDRYFYSCIANHRANGYKDDTWLREIFTNVPEPDLAFFLDVDVETAVYRVRQRPNERNRWIDIQLWERLRKEYATLAEEYDGYLVPSGKNTEETFKSVRTHVDELLEKVQTDKNRRYLYANGQ